MLDYVHRLLQLVDAATVRLLEMNDETTARRPGPGKWSPREIVGHLIDSASNNHGRFVRAQFQDDLVFEGYAQDDWVATQRYQHAPWRQQVDLWLLFNRHLAGVMGAVPEDVRMRPRQVHNLHRIAFRPVPHDQPATLDYLMRDYVDHLEHHLKQILGPGDLA